MEFLKKHSALIVLGIIIALGSYAIGVHRGKESVPSTISLLNSSTGEPQTVDFAPFWKAWNIINEKYISASTTKPKVSDQDKVYGAIEGLASSLGDPYTVFFPPVESEMFASDIRGNFEGVGMEVLAQNGAITVIAPLKGSPAEAAGIKAGDHIIQIDKESTANMATEDAVQKIRGKDGTTVSLTLVRSGATEPITVSVKRAVIDLPIINTQKLDNGIFKIDLYSFSENSPNLFRGALREFVLSGDHKLILDLRGNPGGYLEAAIDMASWFLPSSKVVVREDFSGAEEQKVYRSRGYDIFNNNLQLIILTDKGSASASEILAGALKEQGVAKLVGDTTFGKGSVQELVDITDNTSLKVTVARWLTPNGVSISEKGVEPDYKVLYTAADKAAGTDPQLKKAIEILNSAQ
jgi:carboxyl-terminal processing protease